jgi:hypothetical protein
MSTLEALKIQAIADGTNEHAVDEIVSFMKIFSTCAAALSPVVVLMNWVGLFAGVVWLGVLGEWTLLWQGTASWLFSSKVLGLIVFLLSLPFLALGAFAESKRSRTTLFATAISSMWAKYFVISLWLAGAFSFCVHSVHSNAIIPACLIGFTLAVTPWADLGASESDNPQTMISTVCIHALALVLMLGFAFGQLNFATGFGLCSGILNICALAQYRLTEAITVTEGKNFFPPDRHLKWFEASWASLPHLLVLFGGYIFGPIGVAGGYINNRLFNSNLSPFMKYLTSGLVSAICTSPFIIWTAVYCAYKH